MTAATKAVSRHRATIERWQSDPFHFVTQVLGRSMWSRQRSMLESVRDHRRTAVRSCHGPGKTATAASALLWFLYSFPGSRVVSTATTWPQVRDLLWHEVNQQHRNARGALGGLCLETRLKLRDGRYATGLSTRVGQEESFAGHHAEHILLLIDEASGVREAIYEVAEGYMTTEGARMLLVGNPTQPAGEFYSAFHTKRDEYATQHISAFDCPAFTGEAIPDDVAAKLVTQQWVNERRKSWGEGSPLWDVRVMGNFPKGASDAVVAIATVEAAQQRTYEPHPEDEDVVACDVARFGDDETVIARRQGKRCELLETYSGKPTTETAGKLARYHRELGSRVVVDDAGVGGGVTDILREQGLSVTAFNGGESAFEPDEYPNARSELWFVAADELLDADLPEDEQLAADLVAPVYRIDSKGRRVVEPKEQTKKRIGRSPDRGDALLLTYAAERAGTIEVW